MHGCPKQETLIRYNAGGLSQSDEAGIKEHLKSCDQCDRANSRLISDNEAWLERVRVAMQPAGGDEKTASLDTAPRKTSPSTRPEQIGRYRILDEIGQGGMGTVYLAEQREPVRRRVALKLIKVGLDTKEVVARFENERQALALLDHPNVAKVFDGGATETGRPYFVMEYIAGLPITDYCDKHRLSTTQRLELFAVVCRAVQHAHHKGIIHRDLKPSNVLIGLIDAVPTPKVIDFGVAKATQQNLTERTLVTTLGQIVGTPEYMSPEQADMRQVNVDTRTDVYTLGVILYELLVGTLPFDRKVLRRKAFDEMLRVIREDTPPKPSIRLSGSAKTSEFLAQNHQTSVGALTRRLKGDLDWIVMKALAKEPAERYETVSAFAEDIRRHLGGDAVLAGPPSVLYQVRKFARRNLLPIAAMSATMLALLVGLVVSFLQYERAETAREAALLQAQKAEQVSEILKNMVEGINADVAQGRETPVLDQIVADTAKRIDDHPALLPEVEIELRTVLGEINRNMGRVSEAQRQFRAAISAGRNAALEMTDGFAQALSLAARTELDTGDFTEADRLAREGLEIARALHGERHEAFADGLFRLGQICWNRPDNAEAERLHRLSLAIRKELFGDESKKVSMSMHGLGLALEGLRIDEAEEVHQENLQLRKKLYGTKHPAYALTLNSLGRCYVRKGKPDEAAEYYREALRIAGDVYGEEHRMVALYMENLATALRAAS